MWRFDSTRNEWRGENTLAFVGSVLELEEGKEGAQRNAFMVEFINQDKEGGTCFGLFWVVVDLSSIIFDRCASFLSLIHI